MQLEQVSKERTKELEINTTPVVNLFWGAGTDEQLHKKYFDIVTFIYNHGFTTLDSVYVRVNKISELLGFKQNYYVNYEYRSAVWGLKWKGQEFVIYYSNKGFSVQCKRRMPVKEFINELHNLLVI